MKIDHFKFKDIRWYFVNPKELISEISMNLYVSAIQ